MRKSNWIFICILSFPLMFWQCGQNSSSGEEEETMETASDSESDAANDPQKAMEEAMKQLENMQKEAGKVEVVDFRELKIWLPETLNGLERSRHEGQKAGAMGFTVSEANATYKGDGKDIEVTVVDGGGVGLAQMGLAAWAMAEIDQEDDNGWKRTTTIAGQKAYQEHSTRDNSGQVSILVAGRGVLNIEYSGMDSGDAEGLLKELDLKDLARILDTEK